MKNFVYINVLKQLSEILSQLQSDSYARSLSVLNGSSIGQHVRHIIEFYQCLLKGVQQGVIDYDARERNLLLETDVYYTQNTINQMVEAIGQIKKPNETLLLAASFDATEPIYIETNFLREMVYMVEHSIHHFALIRIGIQENFEEIAIPENFGIAYSTIKHRETITE